MSQKETLIKYSISITLFILSIFILFIDFKNISFTVDYLLLLFAFWLISFVFNYMNIIGDKKSPNKNIIISANFNYPFIFLTNPLFAFVYSIGFSIVHFLLFKEKENAFLFGLQNFMVTYITYIFIFKIMGSKELLLTPTFLMLLIVAFLISISIERLILVSIHWIEGKVFSLSDAEKIFTSGYIPTFLIALFNTPIIVLVYNISGFSGLLFPIGLIFVMSYTFNSNLNKQKQLEDFKERSYRDGLTGLYNRRYLEEYMDGLSTYSGTITVIMMDIDKFKLVNDNYNHSVGDQVLKHFAIILQRCVRQYDMVARYGGEEFTIILKNLSPEQSKIVAERIRASVEASYAPVEYNGSMTNVKYTTSLGLFYSHEHRSYHLTESIKEADKLLYASKKGGRKLVTSNIY